MPGLHDLYTDSQLNDLKRLAILSAGLGAGVPLISRLLAFKTPTQFGSSTEGTSVGIPVIDGTKSERSDSVLNRKPGKTEKFDPSYGLIVRKKSKDDSEKKAFSIGDLTNPYFLPGVVASVGAPFLAVNYAYRKLLDDKAIKQEEINDAKRNLAKQMMQNQIAARMPEYDDYEVVGSAEDKLKDLYEKTKEKSQQVASKAKESGKGLLNKLLGKKNTEPANQPEVKFAEASDFISNLDKLASIYIEKKGKDGQNEGLANKFINVWDAGSGAVQKYFTDYYGSPTAALNKAVQAAKDALGGYTGTLMGLGLAGLGTGAYLGYKDKSKDDPEELIARHYYNQFLQRQQEQGMPIRAYTTPIKFK